MTSIRAGSARATSRPRYTQGSTPSSTLLESIVLNVREMRVVYRRDQRRCHSEREVLKPFVGYA